MATMVPPGPEGGPPALEEAPAGPQAPAGPPAGPQASAGPPAGPQAPAGGLWTREIFLASVPPHLQSDPDILALAEQFRVETERNLRAQGELRARVLALRQELAQGKATHQS